MTEPDIINTRSLFECPDCDGEGEQEYPQPGSSADLEQNFMLEPCASCNGTGRVKLAELEQKP